MTPTTLRYARPRTVAEATEMMSQQPWQIIAGATDVYPRTVGRELSDDALDLTGVAELRGIDEVDGLWRIGALTTWTDVASASLPAQFTGLQQAALQIGGLQIQNRGTVGGNLCTASPAGDSIPMLLAMSASVELVSHSGTRLVPLDEFITGYRSTVLQSSELVASIQIPSRSGPSNFQKLGSRSHLVISIAMVATQIEDGPAPTVRVAVGACSPVARRISGLEGQLNSDCDPQIAAAYDYPELDPIDDVRGSASYRHDVVGPLVARSIEQCLEMKR